MTKYLHFYDICNIQNFISLKEIKIQNQEKHVT